MITVNKLGHSIGFHCDIHHLLDTTTVDLYSSVQNICSDYSNEIKAPISSINLHGNTKLRKLYGSPKALLKHREEDDEAIYHVIPATGKYVDLQSRYSMQSFAEKCGLEYWCDGYSFFVVTTKAELSF